MHFKYLLFMQNIFKKNRNKDKLSINGANVQEGKNTTNKRPKAEIVKKQWIYDIYDNIRFSKIFYANLQLRVRCQKAYFCVDLYF